MSDTSSPSRTDPPAPPTDAEVAGPTAAVVPADSDSDPYGLGPVVEALSPADREASLAAVAVLSVLLRPGEQVSDLVVGRLDDADAVVALTGERLLLVNDRRFKAHAVEFPLRSEIEVQGWQDADEATIVITGPSDSATVGHIDDRSAAQRLAVALQGDS